MDSTAGAVAAATIATRIMMFTLMPAWGMSNAAATLVGQNLGTGELARAEAAAWRIGWMNMAFTLSVSVAFFLLHNALIAPGLPGSFAPGQGARADPATRAVGG